MNRKDISNMPTVAIYNGNFYDYVEIKEINDINDTILCTVTTGENTTNHRIRIFNDIDGREYIRLYRNKLFLDEFIRV